VLQRIALRSRLLYRGAESRGLDAYGPSTAGLALLRSYAGRELEDLLPTSRGGSLREKVPAEDGRGASLYGALGTRAWVAAHLRRGARIPHQDRIGATYARAVRVELVDRAAGEQDLISGTVGHGVYALECRRAGGVSGLFGLVLARFDALSAASPLAVPILPRTRRGRPGPSVDLGVAHGMAGVVALLAMAVRHRVEVRRARARLRRFSAWLVAHALLDGQRCCSTTLDRRPSRLAWCYGEAGTATALLAAGQALGDDALVARAVILARAAAARPAGTTGIVDASLCHGSAGLAHVFARLFNATGDPIFRSASEEWFHRTFDLQRPDGSFVSHRGGDRFEPDEGFLTGSLGVALACASGVSAVEPSWDRVLLLELPNGAAR
jgi:lantibiotic biosynthesis protein